MDFKVKIEEYLEAEDLLYIDVFMKNGVSFNLYQPNQGGTLNVETKAEYLHIYGDVDEYRRVDTVVPYDNISHVNGAFGEPQEPDFEVGE